MKIALQNQLQMHCYCRLADGYGTDTSTLLKRNNLHEMAKKEQNYDQKYHFNTLISYVVWHFCNPVTINCELYMFKYSLKL